MGTEEGSSIEQQEFLDTEDRVCTDAPTSKYFDLFKVCYKTMNKKCYA